MVPLIRLEDKLLIELIVNKFIMIVTKFFPLTLLLSSFPAEISPLTSVDTNLTDIDDNIYKPFNSSFLAYFLKLRQEYILNLSGISQTSRYWQECFNRSHSISFYNHLVYEALCQDSLTDSNCNFLNPSLCKFVITLALETNSNHTNVLEALQYEEIISEDISFCIPVICPLAKEDHFSNKTTSFSFFDCMPSWCKCGFYVVFIVDILLSIAITISNIVVLCVGLNHNFLNSPGG